MQTKKRKDETKINLQKEKNIYFKEKNLTINKNQFESFSVILEEMHLIT